MDKERVIMVGARESTLNHGIERKRFRMILTLDLLNHKR